MTQDFAGAPAAPGGVSSWASLYLVFAVIHVSQMVVALRWKDKINISRTSVVFAYTPDVNRDAGPVKPGTQLRGDHGTPAVQESGPERKPDREPPVSALLPKPQGTNFGELRTDGHVGDRLLRR